ncbi:hypothetical protein PISMIDRAFT_686548 [Pisolithus microcarpus 441]|uniref:Uncharacterized protein n=1 Tax=Pisolithus microcarpus 441 TaxID=765257 RepID=A0A0C9YHK5_9AGAM|nr:hypothetical protein BKA83DRAFT_686548 [Pisolithus microcarpus]KIK16161.1 hypothetical protein PISMIDRAFT_686548 [Pisolithus microcarpus 441]
MVPVNMCGSKDLHRRCRDVPCRRPVAGHSTQFIMTLHMGQLPVGMALGYVLFVSATGEEHKRFSDQRASFQQLHDVLPVLLCQCWPDEAELQQWYIDRGQYDFIIADGMMVNELTSGSDLWARVQAGTKIVMRVITEEVVTCSAKELIIEFCLHLRLPPHPKDRRSEAEACLVCTFPDTRHACGSGTHLVSRARQLPIHGGCI